MSVQLSEAGRCETRALGFSASLASSEIQPQELDERSGARQLYRQPKRII